MESAVSGPERLWEFAPSAEPGYRFTLLRDGEYTPAREWPGGSCVAPALVSQPSQLILPLAASHWLVDGLCHPPTCSGTRAAIQRSRRLLGPTAADAHFNEARAADGGIHHRALCRQQVTGQDRLTSGAGLELVVAQHQAADAFALDHRHADSGKAVTDHHCAPFTCRRVAQVEAVLRAV